MRTSARTNTSAPVQRSASAPLKSSARPQPIEEHQAQRTRIDAIRAASLTCLCTGGACCMVLTCPMPWGDPLSVGIACAIVLASIFASAALALIVHKRSLRNQHPCQETRAEHIQHELDALDLTDKEMPIARLILQHRSYQEIAAQCHLSQRTVQFHASNIFRKAYVRRRRDFEHVMLAEQPAGTSESNPSVRQIGTAAQPDSTGARADEMDFARTQGASLPLSAYASQYVALAPDPSHPAFPNAAQLSGGTHPQQPHIAVPLPRAAHAFQANPHIVEEQWFSTRLANTPTTARSRFALQQKSSCPPRERERSVGRR